MKTSRSGWRRFLIAMGTASLAACGGGGGDVATHTDTSQFNPAEPVSDWQMVWSDEFDGSVISANRWNLEVNCAGGGNNEQQCYTDNVENAFVADGYLNIVALPAAEGAEKPYTSARLNSKHNGDFKYGRIEVRAQMPFGQGAWGAVWMLPTDNVYGGWPNSGEIDIVETVNLKAAKADGSPEDRIFSALHYGDVSDPKSSGKEYVLPGGANPADDFHEYAIEWNEGEIRWYVDDYLYATQRRSVVRYNSKDEAVGLAHRGWYTKYYDPATGEMVTAYDNAPYDQDFHILMNLAVGGNWPESVNELGVNADAFANGQTLKVDYVRVYECSMDPYTGKGCETVRGGYDSLDDALVEGQAPIPAPPSTGVAQNLFIFDGTANPNWAAWDCCGGSTPMLTADADRGDVYEFYVGATPTVNGFISRAAFITDPTGSATPFDASPMAEGGVLSFDMKVVSAPNDAGSVWKLKVESIEGATAVELNLSDSIEGAAPAAGAWQTYTFSLAQLQSAGLDLSAIDVVMIFPAWGTGEGAIYQVDNLSITADIVSPSLVIFEDAENASWPAWDCCGGSTPEVVTDEDAAHGAAAEFAIGGSPTVMGFISRSAFTDSPAPFDASAILSNGVVQFDMKVMSAPLDASSTWLFKVEADDAATAVELPLTSSIEGAAPVVGQWQTYTFALSDLADAGLDVSAIDVIMVFPAWGTGDGAVYRLDNAKIYDPTAGGEFMGHVLFTNGPVDNWSIWDCCGGSTPQVVGDDADHGAVAEYQIGGSPTVMGLLAADGVYLDASDVLATGVVQFEMKVESAPLDASSTWLFKIESNDAGEAVELALTDSQEGVAPVVGQWQTYTYSLQDLFDAGLDVSAIDVLMVFPAWGTGDGAVYKLDNVMIYDPSTLPSAKGLALFDNAAATGWSIWDCCAGSTPTVEVDDNSHGLAAEFVIGGAPTVMGLLADDGVYYDAGSLTANGYVRFDMKVVSAPTDASSTWLFKIESNDAGEAVELALNASVEGADPVVGEWQTYTFMLQDLFDAGLDVSAIDVVMVFPAWGTGDGAVYRIDNMVISGP